MGQLRIYRGEIIIPIHDGSTSVCAVWNYEEWIGYIAVEYNNETGEINIDLPSVAIGIN